MKCNIQVNNRTRKTDVIMQINETKCLHLLELEGQGAKVDAMMVAGGGGGLHVRVVRL